MESTSDQGPRLTAGTLNGARDGLRGGDPAPRARRRRLFGWSRRLAGDERGAVTVEYVIWLPFFFFLFLLIVDASMAFFAKAEAHRVVQSGNRLYSTNQHANEAAVKTWVEAAFDGQSQNATATTVLNNNRTIVATQLSIPLREVLLVNIFRVPATSTMTVQSQHYVEWPRP